jgi:hypothetical protein
MVLRTGRTKVGSLAKVPFKDSHLTSGQSAEGHALESRQIQEAGPLLVGPLGE